jgi:hypothetical protein
VPLRFDHTRISSVRLRTSDHNGAGLSAPCDRSGNSEEGVMTTTRKVGIASAVSGLLLSLLMAAPPAHADVLADLRGTVNGDRAKSTCAPLKYNQILQDIGFAMGQFIPEPQASIDQKKAAYGGDVRPFIGVGDPMAAARTDAYKKGAGSAIHDCYFTEFGVSFVRYEPTETDWVGLVFGRPATVTPPSGPGAPGGTGQPPGGGEQKPPQPPPPPQTRQCPPGGLKPEVPVNEKCPAPTNAVTVSFDRGFVWTVNVKNNAGIGGSCTYRATSTTGLTGASEDFDIAPNGTASFQVPAPLPFTTYNVVTKCTGTYDGQQVEFGNNSQTVSL